MPRVLITSCSMFGNRFLSHISWWMTNWAVQLISIVSLCLQDRPHQISVLIENDDFFSCHTNFRLKPVAKNWYLVCFNFLGYLGEIVSDSWTVWTCIHIGIRSIYTINGVPGSALPTFKFWFAVVDEIRLWEPLSAFWLVQRLSGKKALILWS